jgi:hypothetical protein
MADGSCQDLTHHARYDPRFHFFVLPVFFASWIFSAVLAVRHPGFLHIWVVIFNTALVITAFRARQHALRVQDRLIRLEERLRLSECLPDLQRSQIAILSEGQLIALRFASDDELPALVEQAVSQRLSGREIKKVIKNWRPDHFRV